MHSDRLVWELDFFFFPLQELQSLMILSHYPMPVLCYGRYFDFAV